MEIKVSEVMQREDNSLYLKEIEVINYEKVEILNTPDNVVKLMTDVFEINKKISEEIFVIALTTLLLVRKELIIHSWKSIGI